MTRRNTKDLILTTSLALFNEFGEPNVTTNHIADEAEISPGNLYYHYRSKDDIILELFKRFTVRFQPLLEVSPEAPLEAEDLWFLLLLSFQIKGEFRFFYRNLADLTARIPQLEKAMRGLLSLERQAIMNSFEGMKKADIIQLDERETAALADNVLLILTYWISFAEFMQPGGVDSGDTQTYSIARLMLLLTPHMREPERSQFESLIDQYFS